MTALNEQIILLLFRYFNERNWEAIEQLYAEQFQLLHPVMKNDFVLKNRWNVAHRYAALRRRYDDINEEIQTIHAEGNKVFVHFIINGKEGNGQKFSLPCWSIFTVEQGKIIKDASYYSVPLKAAV